MTNTKKISRIISVVLALTLMAAMAVPSFAAAQSRALVGVDTTFETNGTYLTVNASSAFNYAGVGMMTDLGTKSRWVLRQGSDGYYRIYTSLSSNVGSGYVLNRHANGFTCMLWRDFTDSVSQRDSIVDLLTSSPNHQIISLERASGNKYLKNSGGSSGGPVDWYVTGTVYTVNP